MRQQRITKAEIEAALRDIDAVANVALETGSLSFVSKSARQYVRTALAASGTMLQARLEDFTRVGRLRRIRPT